MEYRNLFDMHTHSDHSFDGHHSCVYLCERAVENGLKGLAITDHCEIDAKDYDFRSFCLNQYTDYLKVDSFFKDSLFVMYGLEIGQALYNLDLADRILAKYHYDFVLASIHNFKDEEDFYYMDYTDRDIKSLLDRYYDNIIELCKWGKFDSLAHLTYPLRYIYKQTRMYPSLDMNREKIEEILSILIKDNKALEINTSGLFMDVKRTLPDKDIISLFHKMGGEYITIGSDSHFAEKTGKGINEGMEIAFDCGFRKITLYKGHEPILVDIE